MSGFGAPWKLSDMSERQRALLPANIRERFSANVRGAGRPLIEYREKKHGEAQD